MRIKANWGEQDLWLLKASRSSIGCPVLFAACKIKILWRHICAWMGTCGENDFCVQSFLGQLNCVFVGYFDGLDSVGTTGRDGCGGFILGHDGGYLGWAEVFSMGLDGKKLEPESNVLLASIENMQYAVTLDVLHMVFSSFGPVQKIAMFDKNSGLQALIQYPDVQTAVVAKEALEGHCIYDGGFCKLHLSYSRHNDLSIKVNNDRSRDYTIPNNVMVNPQPSILGQQPVATHGPPSHLYTGAQFAPTTEHSMIPQPSSGWATGFPPAPNSMPGQMNINPYVPPGTMPPQMGHGMMQMPSHGGPPHTHAMPPYRPYHMQ
ncbi:polypyrimidine tract-binding protein [Populus alba x Populus x berolinensis]|nr:polypyrimidine tract-binding protein [Populus alba x Populus x berolinensis]